MFAGLFQFIPKQRGGGVFGGGRGGLRGRGGGPQRGVVGGPPPIRGAPPQRGGFGGASGGFGGGFGGAAPSGPVAPAEDGFKMLKDYKIPQLIYMIISQSPALVEKVFSIHKEFIYNGQN